MRKIMMLIFFIFVLSSCGKEEHAKKIVIDVDGNMYHFKHSIGDLYFIKNGVGEAGLDDVLKLIEMRKGCSLSKKNRKNSTKGLFKFGTDKVED